MVFDWMVRWGASGALKVNEMIQQPELGVLGVRCAARQNVRMLAQALAVCLLVVCSVCVTTGAAEPPTEALWPGTPPGPAALVAGEEQDLTKPDDRLIAGKRIIKLGNVAQPEMQVFLPSEGQANGGAVVICPGGGFSILAWDLEGTEVAQWLTSLGFVAVVVKYRVPTRRHGGSGKWQGPVMDAQRALSLTRSRADQWGLDPNRIGILGFSAGGETAARAAVQQGQRLYEPVDEADHASCAANFAVLIYPAGIAEEDGTLKESYPVDAKTPPMFFVHAADDNVSCLHSVALFTALKQADVPAELHIFTTGGHGYGLRPTDQAVTRWTERAASWLEEIAAKAESANP